MRHFVILYVYIMRVSKQNFRDFAPIESGFWSLFLNSRYVTTMASKLSLNTPNVFNLWYDICDVSLNKSF